MVIIIYEWFFLFRFTFVFAYCTLYYLNLFTRFEIRMNIINELKPERTRNMYNYRYKSLRLVRNGRKKIVGKTRIFSGRKSAHDRHCVNNLFISRVIRRHDGFQRCT